MKFWPSFRKAVIIINALSGSVVFFEPKRESAMFLGGNWLLLEIALMITGLAFLIGSTYLFLWIAARFIDRRLRRPSFVATFSPFHEPLDFFHLGGSAALASGLSLLLFSLFSKEDIMTEGIFIALGGLFMIQTVRSFIRQNPKFIK